MTKPIPDGYHTLTPHLVVDGGADALDFYERAFGAEVRSRLDSGGMVMHAEVRIGDSLLTVSDAMPDFGLAAPDTEGPVTSSLMIYCDDADAVHAPRPPPARPRSTMSPTSSTATAPARCATRSATAGRSRPTRRTSPRPRCASASTR